MKIICKFNICLVGLLVLVVGSVFGASGKTLRIFVLTGQSNSLGTPATTETNMILPQVQSYPADTNVPFFWDNTSDNTPAGDAALGDSGGQWTNICFQTGGYYAYSTNHWGPEVGCARMLWDAGYRDFGIVKGLDLLDKLCFLNRILSAEIPLGRRVSVNRLSVSVCPRLDLDAVGGQRIRPCVVL